MCALLRPNMGVGTISQSTNRDGCTFSEEEKALHHFLSSVQCDMIVKVRFGEKLTG